jgi:GT2 family glycosyltransferase
MTHTRTGRDDTGVPAEKPLSVDVVIPTYNAWELTRSCLRHLAAQTVEARVILVDNGSSDGTPERAAEEFPSIAVEALGSNAGFAAACNAGVRLGAGDVVVLLNNDVDVSERFLGRLVAPFRDDPRLGSVAPLLLRPDGRIDSLGICADATLAGFPRLQGRDAGEAATDGTPPLGPSGGAAAYRRLAWDDVGGMDERMFMYSEDLDIALRLRARGWRSRAEPSAVATHLGSATAGRRSAWQRERSGFSRGYLLRRYGVLRGGALPRTLLTEALVVAGDAVLSRDLAAGRGRLRGWRAASSLARIDVPDGAVDASIGLRDSMARRRSDYALAAGARSTPKRVP